jgi:hypothetical protein
MEINFINGKAIVKQGRRIIAKVYDRAVFYPANNIKAGYSSPYSLEMAVGQRECATVEEAKHFIEKYL